MDILYYIVYYSALAFVPFILYFLLLKKRNNDGSYKGAGEWSWSKKQFENVFYL